MKNVTRKNKPTSLVNNSSRWKRELLTELAKPRGSRDIKKITNIGKRYAQDDVRNILNQMYNGLCCYCESRISPASYEHIEHRAPKSIFPELTFEWNNLHLACSVCNNKKLNKWDSKDEILDSVDDEINGHLKYLGPHIDNITKRGYTTIQHANLNRSELLNARTVILAEVIKVLDEIKGLPNIRKAKYESELNKMVNEQFGSIVQHLMDNYN